jgi:phosphopantothenoylcysteine synthetase/decarboxylase
MKKKILVTAGNTLSPIDKVRVVTNIFSGETGCTIALQLAKKGFKVHLLVADVRLRLKNYKHKNITIQKAPLFDDFEKALKKALKTKKYKAVIMAAAVSDFRIKKVHKSKIKSGKKQTLTFYPTPKLVDLVRKISPKTILIKFKLESKKKNLIKTALKSKKESKANLIIANTPPKKNKHTFYIIKSKKKIKKISGKKKLAKTLSSIFKKELK